MHKNTDLFIQFFELLLSYKFKPLAYYEKLNTRTSLCIVFKYYYCFAVYRRFSALWILMDIFK